MLHPWGDLISSQRGGKFTVQVQHMFGGGNLDLLDYLKTLDAKLKRDVIRKMVGAAGQLLVKEIRKEIAERDMPTSRLKGKTKKQLKLAGSVPLKYTIGKRVWSRPERGIIGCVVGPQWPQGAHGHLVEFGHKITGRAKVTFRALHFTRGMKFKFKTYKIGRRQVSRSGQRTIAHGFQQEAMGNIERDIFYVMSSKMSAALKAAGNPHLSSAQLMGQLAHAAEQVF